MTTTSRCNSTRSATGNTPKLTFEWTGPVTLALFHTYGQQRLRRTEVAAVERPLDTDADRAGVEVMFGGFPRLVWSATASRGAGVDALDTLPSLTPLRPHADLTGDFLVTYLVAPGRALFIGVNRYEQRRAPQSLNQGWQMFAKISYALQM